MTLPPLPHDLPPPTGHFILDETRFQEPPGWRWHKFTTSGGYRLRYGSVYPKDSIADAVVVCLPGLSDFGEKYLELAQTMLEHNMAFWVIDWRGQGDSDRYLTNRHKRHSSGYDRDIRDLYELVDGYILPSAVHPDVGRLPLVMLGHSMGGHIGLRYLHDCNTSSKGKQAFMAGAFSAPMMWIHMIDAMPMLAVSLLSSLLCLMPTSYIPGQGKDWFRGYRDQPHLKDIYTHDDVRGKLQDLWFTRNADLQIGGPTNRWLYETVKSARKLNKASYLKGINVPTLVGVAGSDTIVSNRMIRRAAKHIPKSTLVEIPGGRHELLMEIDQHRQPFLDHFFSFVEANVLRKLDRGMTKF